MEFPRWPSGSFQGKGRSKHGRCGMDEKQRAGRANKMLQASVNAFNKATKGKLPIIKKQTAESMTKDWSEAMKQSFMSRIDLS